MQVAYLQHALRGQEAGMGEGKATQGHIVGLAKATGNGAQPTGTPREHLQSAYPGKEIGKHLPISVIPID